MFGARRKKGGEFKALGGDRSFPRGEWQDTIAPTKKNYARIKEKPNKRNN